MLKDLDINSMYEEIKFIYLANNSLFSTQQPTIRLCDILNYLEKEASYNIATIKTLKNNISAINKYISAIYRKEHNLYNPALLDNSRLFSLEIQHSSKPEDIKRLKDIKELQNLPAHTRFFYYRIYYYLSIEELLPIKKLKYTIRSYPIPFLFSPIFIGIIYSIKTEKQGYPKMKEIIISKATDFFNEPNYFNSFLGPKFFLSTEFKENLKIQYSNWINLMFPDQLYNLYEKLLEKKSKNTLSEDSFSQLDNIALTQILASLPQQFFLSLTGYELYYSEILNLLDTSTNLLQDASKVREEIMLHEFNLWNQIVQKKSESDSI